MVVVVVVVVIEWRWRGGGEGLRGTATWPDSVAATLPASIATGTPSGSACVDWGDVCGVVSGFSFQFHHVLYTLIPMDSPASS